MAKVIAILTSKGGVGKTQTALEVAAALSRSENKVLCIDMDGQRNLSGRVGCNLKAKNIYDCLDIDTDMTKEEVFELIDSAIQHCEECDIICGSTKLSKADKVFSDKDDIFLLRNFIKILERKKYDYIIIDNPPARNIASDMSIIAGDYALLISDGSKDARQGIEYVLDDIQAYRSDERANWTHIQVLGIIMTKVRSNTIHYQATGDLYEDVIIKKIQDKGLGKDVFFDTVCEAIEVMQAGNKGQSCQKYKPYGNVARDYRRVTTKIVERMPY